MSVPEQRLPQDVMGLSKDGSTYFRMNCFGQAFDGKAKLSFCPESHHDLDYILYQWLQIIILEFHGHYCLC